VVQRRSGARGGALLERRVPHDQRRRAGARDRRDRRGGLSLVGLAAAEAVDGNPERAAQIASAAEQLAQQDGIVVLYSTEAPGHDLVEAARAALSADELARATDVGRRLTVAEILEIARDGAPAGAASSSS
jgi:hypothetical protein